MIPVPESPHPYSRMTQVIQHLMGLMVRIPNFASDLQNLAAQTVSGHCALANLQFDRLVQPPFFTRGLKATLING